MIKTEIISQQRNKKQLIYVSLGATYLNSSGTIIKIIDGLKTLRDASAYANQLPSGYTVLVSCGKKVLADIQTQLDNKTYHVPDNFVLVDSVPQIEVLKRASLFVTHSGMNSTSEAIHYGVPMVCIPNTVDQPLNAYRVADELGAGIRIVSADLSAEKVRDAVCRILTDKRYLERCLRLTQVSRRHNGSLNAARIARDYALEHMNKKKTE